MFVKSLLLLLAVVRVLYFGVYCEVILVLYGRMGQTERDLKRQQVSMLQSPAKFLRSG